MDMGSSTTSMAASSTIDMVGMASTTSSGTAAATTTMSIIIGGNYKISMLWNWYMDDACFISESWHITSHGMFAGSCIGVIIFVMSLEFLRRLGKEYERSILRQHQRTASCTPTYQTNFQGGKIDSETGSTENRPLTARSIPATFNPSAIRQAVRATLHMVQFAVAYFVMLLATYYNGHFIICIIIGAWLGAFVFSWDSVSLVGPKEEVTVCCGQ